MAKPTGFEKLGTSKSLSDTSLEAVKGTGAFIFGGAGKAGSAGTGVVGKAGGLVKGTASWMAGSTANIINGATRVIGRFPKTSVLLGVGAGALALKSHYDNKRAAADANYTLAQIKANKAFVPQGAESPYKNSVTPEETAELNARMRDTAQPGFEASIAAQRAQPQPQPAVKA